MSMTSKRFIPMFLVTLLVIPQFLTFPGTANAEESEEIPVLLYHRVVEEPSNEWTDTSIEAFEQQLEYLNENGYTTLTADQYVDILEGKAEAPENPILLTFDDATPDFITTVLPRLQAYDMNAVLFVISDWIGGDYSMSEEQLQSLVGNPNVSLENHSKTHDEEVWGTDGSVRSEITKEEAETEIAEASNYLKKVSGEAPVLMAYPYGSYNDITKEVNEENGIKYAFKVGYPSDGDYAMGRHYVTDQNLSEYAELIGGPPVTEAIDADKEADGGELADTATNSLHYVLLGLMLAFAGAAFLVRNRRKA